LAFQADYFLSRCNDDIHPMKFYNLSSHWTGKINISYCNIDIEQSSMTLLWKQKQTCSFVESEKIYTVAMTVLSIF